MKHFAITLSAMVLFCVGASAAPRPGEKGEHFNRGPKVKDAPPSSIEIGQDPVTRKVTVFQRGRGVLKQSTTLTGRFRPSRMQGAWHVEEPEADQMIFRFEPAGGEVYSVNVVGYVNVFLPPGLSLIANPLHDYDNTIETLMLYNDVPDGAQIYKYVPGVGYEVNAFNAQEQAWSNPDMTLPVGVGFFFNNPSTNTIRQTFVGEVLQGRLVNPLPAGFATVGALVPQEGSINTVHNVPGQAGDVIRFYTNDLHGGGDYVSSTFVEAEHAWIPDLILKVAQGFTCEKQVAVDWVRDFRVN